jgi:hypothetical protein
MIGFAEEISQCPDFVGKLPDWRSRFNRKTIGS